jgi:hypothetical protein
MRFVQPIDGQTGPAIVETRTTVAEAHVGRFEVLRWFGEVSRGGQAMAMNAERAA